ncbi:hypothetical protein Cadr_000009271 [Camelus dromedarius]|uniref:Uncharacterized protein n=1 Tax=Camelus dromedarius TaxID=9838 RepID=A0A5N4DIE8_CAMDR|nr:hypothetical protein Cadr_000009271 [Camelus dromedarius]
MLNLLSPPVYCQCFWNQKKRKAEKMLMILNLLKAALEFCLDVLEPLTRQCPTFHTPVHPSFNPTYAREIGFP